MRLGQLARKYNLSQEQIIKFLDDHNPGMGPYHNNTKLSDQVENLIATHFDKDFSQEIVEEEPGNISEEPIVKEIEPEEPIPDVEPEELTESRIQEELDPSLPVVESPEPAREDERKAIATDKLIELLDSEDEEVDLSDITLIKAPKKELEGLKVVGKIDLPEPKPKSEEKEKEKSPRDGSRGKKSRNSKRNELSAEEKEKRRLRAKRKKEEYEARQKKKRQQEEAEKLKARKKAHYEQKLKKKQAAARAKVKESKEQEKPELIPVAQKPAKPKSSLGRFWAWFWRGEKV